MPTWQRKINVRQRLCVPRVSKHPASNKCTIVCGVRGQESSQDQSLFQSWYTVDRESLSPSRFRWESSRGDCDKKWLVRMLPPPAMEPPLLFYLKQNNCLLPFKIAGSFSVEDERFMNILEEGINKREDGQHKMLLPLRSKEVALPKKRF